MPKCCNHQDCPAGRYTKGAECFDCQLRFYQDLVGQSTCKPCKRGFYQPKSGQMECIPCRAGGYYNQSSDSDCDGGFKPCPIGTFNKDVGKSLLSDCLPCPVGTLCVHKYTNTLFCIFQLIIIHYDVFYVCAPFLSCEQTLQKQTPPSQRRIYGYNRYAKVFQMSFPSVEFQRRQQVYHMCGEFLSKYCRL